MRFWALCGILSSLLLRGMVPAQLATEGTASVAGLVKGAEGPVAVYLQSGDEDPTRYYDGYQAQTDKDGRFTFTEIAPGTYRLRAEAMGFMNSGRDGDEGIKITLRPHDKRKGVVIPMVRRLALCGEVTENGNPKQSFMSVFRYDPEFGTLSNTYPPGTEPNGSYWFSDLEPGTYYLRGDMTWYPGSFSFSGAKPVVIGPSPGPPACPFDIPLQHTWVPAKISGRIAASDDDHDAQYRVSFLQRNANGGSMRALTIEATKDLYKAGDAFSARVPSGDYDVVLTDKQEIGGGFRAHKVIFDSKTVSAQTNIDDLELTPHHMASISGEVHFEDITRYASCPGLGGQHVDILREGDGQFQTAGLDGKNRFAFQNVAPGDYKIYLGPFLREAVYLKSITVDGKAVEGRRISIQQATQFTMDVTLSGELASAAGHLPPDLRREHRWEVPWTRPRGSVAGKVHGSAVRGYTVRLRSARYNSNASGEYVVHTAADSTFRFEAVDPGVYTLRAESEGSLTSEYGAHEAGQRGTPIIVGRGAHLKDLSLSPPDLGTICGRVTDENGVPRSGLRIFVDTFENGQLVDKSRSNMYLGHESEALQTDSTGRFRADKLAPGEYFFAFPSSGYLSAFFSSDGSLGTATPVQLPPGRDLGCGSQAPLELRVPTVINQSHRISGQVVGDLPKSVGDRFWVSMTWDHGPGGHPWAGSANLDDDHKFHLDNVPNGRFLLELHSAYGPAPTICTLPCDPVTHLLATQTVAVLDADVLDLKITSLRLPSVSGFVRFEHVPEQWKNFDFSSQFVTLALLDYRGDYRVPLAGKLSADGSFTIDPVDVGDYEVQLAQLRHPFSIRSVRLDGREIAGGYLHLQADQTARLEVIVSGDSGQMDATVSPDPSLPMPEPPVPETCDSLTWPRYQLILIPDPLPAAETSSEKLHLYYGSSVGDFYHPILQALSLPPGHYRVLAAEHLWKDLAWSPRNYPKKENRQLWSAITQLGEPVTIEPNAKVEVVLPDRTVDVARLAASLGVPLEGGVFAAP
ncbi:MAG: carboxypeptidase-like regulatory domain-containing protein [Terriglobales bacterium]|jgi:hypothetical protein